MRDRFDVVILGLAYSSSWNNDQATTWRALVKGLARRGRRVLFLERERPCHAEHRDIARSAHCTLAIYHGLEELDREHAGSVRDAGAVIVGSGVPEGMATIHWMLAQTRGTRAFYDFDLPITLQQLEQGTCEYLGREQIPCFDLYLSATGGPTSTRLTREWGARRAAAFFCAVDPALHRPARVTRRIDLGYLGAFSADRQPRLERLLLDTARRAPGRQFVVAGSGYPAADWPENILRLEHVAQSEHSRFFSGQRFTLILTRDAMMAAGHSPGVRLFEAAACGVPIISDSWPGIETFFEPGREIILADDGDDVLAALDGIDETRRRAMGCAARNRAFAEHTGERRAAQLEQWLGLGAPAMPTRGRTTSNAHAARL